MFHNINSIRKDKSNEIKVRKLIVKYLNCRMFYNNNFNSNSKYKINSLNKRKRRLNKLIKEINQLLTAPSSSSSSLSVLLSSNSAILNMLLGVLIDGRKLTCKKYMMMHIKVCLQNYK